MRRAVAVRPVRLHAGGNRHCSGHHRPLLLGGVLKGQELIENGRVKNAANDMNGIVAAYNSYLILPQATGDDGPIGTWQRYLARGMATPGMAAGKQ